MHHYVSTLPLDRFLPKWDCFSPWSRTPQLTLAQAVEYACVMGYAGITAAPGEI